MKGTTLVITACGFEPKRIADSKIQTDRSAPNPLPRMPSRDSVGNPLVPASPQPVRFSHRCWARGFVTAEQQATTNPGRSPALNNRSEASYTIRKSQIADGHTERIRQPLA